VRFALFKKSGGNIIENHSKERKKVVQLFLHKQEIKEIE
jgi:hypothetical protein